MKRGRRAPHSWAVSTKSSGSRLSLAPGSLADEHRLRFVAMLLFRAMRKDPSDRPMGGATSNLLGARLGVDVRSDDGRFVKPLSGGMSVTPEDATRLPPHLRPPHLGGVGRLPIFRMTSDALPSCLAYRSDPNHPRKHGFVEPTAPVQFAKYQSSLCATCELWREATA